MGSDFAMMVGYGADLWHGQYTATYPLPAVGLFALLALLPYPLALGLATGVSLALFVAVLRRRALIWSLFYPVLACVWSGQNDLVFLWLLHRASPVSLALATLKPQLFPLALPALLSDRSKWKPFILACLALYGPATVIRPTWPLEWLVQVRDVDNRVAWLGSTSVLELPLIGFGALLAVAALVRLDWRAIFWSANPTLRWYDFSLLAGGSLWLIPLSWMCFGLSQVMGGHPAPVAALGLADLVLRRGREGNLCRGHSRD